MLFPQCIERIDVYHGVREIGKVMQELMADLFRNDVPCFN
jgi:precorrin-4 methylase